MLLESHNGSIVLPQRSFSRSSGISVEELPISEVPGRVARESRCACGDTLTLTDHTVTRTDDLVHIEAVFVCRRCNAAISSKLRRFFGAIWGKTRKLEAGVSGLKYEKEG